MRRRHLPYLREEARGMLREMEMAIWQAGSSWQGAVGSGFVVPYKFAFEC